MSTFDRPITVDELQACNTRLVLENRALRAEVEELRIPLPGNDYHANRRADVMAFFGVAGQEIAAAPHVPSTEVVRLRLRLIAEEFFELLEACIDSTYDRGRQSLQWLDDAKDGFFDWVGGPPAQFRVNLPDFADAIIDLEYVLEGALVAFGIDGEPLWRAVHESNMQKRGGPVVDDKLTKPAGWCAPDILGELRKQGFRG